MKDIKSVESFLLKILLDDELNEGDKKLNEGVRELLIEIQEEMKPLKGVHLDPRNVIRHKRAKYPKQKCPHCNVLFLDKHMCSPELALRKVYRRLVGYYKGVGIEYNISFDQYKLLKDASKCDSCGMTNERYQIVMEKLRETSDRPTELHRKVLKRYNATWHIKKVDSVGGYEEGNVVSVCSFCFEDTFLEKHFIKSEER